MTAPVGRSVHKMRSVFHLPLHPTLTNILPQVIEGGQQLVRYSDELEILGEIRQRRESEKENQ